VSAANAAANLSCEALEAYGFKRAAALTGKVVCMTGLRGKGGVRGPLSAETHGAGCTLEPSGSRSQQDPRGHACSVVSPGLYLRLGGGCLLPLCASQCLTRGEVCVLAAVACLLPKATQRLEFQFIYFAALMDCT
jgi:hypothetical protein